MMLNMLSSIVINTEYWISTLVNLDATTKWLVERGIN